MWVEPDNMYVIPPNASMTISDHTLHIRPRKGSDGIHMPIDAFMRSLAEAHGGSAIGVILSGLGTDGTLGMGEIQAHGGFTFAQEQSTAKYDGMPRSVIASGYADYVLSPKAIARELSRVAREHPHAARQSGEGEDGRPSLAESASMETIFRHLRRVTGVDFSHYRKTTILRRIWRRMVVHNIDKLEDYVRLLNTHPAEIKALYHDMLINVTSFFRNPDVFDALKSTVFPAVLRNLAAESPLRIWVPACASGEETYSVAIALLEFLGDRAPHTPIQLFGTDISEISIVKARNGLYPENIHGDVSPERLNRFFAKVDGGYRISKSIRDMCIFAVHNVAADPPLSQMDLVCCRNLLIYLEPILQNNIVSLFHYALRPGGFLILGTSEGVGLSTLFTAEDRAHKIFAKKAAPRQLVTFSLNREVDRGEFKGVPLRQQDSNWGYMEAQREFDRRLITQYVPAAVFLNEDLEIVHSRGNVNRYLKLPSGRATLGVLKMAREGLFLELRSALARSKREKSVVRRSAIQMRVGDGQEKDSGSRPVDFEVIPIAGSKSENTYYMVIFQDTPPSVPKSGRQSVKNQQQAGKESPAHIARLENELAATKEYLQSIIETHEATNEELQSANEEVMSSNEELQSTNEELGTTKEELQSANEELSTVNEELRNRNVEVTQVNTDLTNLLSSIDLALVMVGRDLTIRQFTPKAREFLGLIPADVGRSLMNISPLVKLSNFQTLLLQVMSQSRAVEEEIHGPDNAPFLLRILPYRTSEGKTEGAVVTFVDLSSRQAASQQGAS
jgi:two-component system, chemotaxis family, CheB/CheR fusion protein